MKKKMLTLLLLAGPMLAWAEGSALLVTLKDGSQTGYILSQKPQVTFSGTALSITTAEVSTDYERADIYSFTFVPESQLTSIRRQSEQNSVIEYRDGTVRAQSRAIEVYNAAGCLVGRAAGSISLESMPGGVYIVRANRQVLKINKK